MFEQDPSRRMSELALVHFDGGTQRTHSRMVCHLQPSAATSKPRIFIAHELRGCQQEFILLSGCSLGEAYTLSRKIKTLNFFTNSPNLSPAKDPILKKIH